MAYTEKVNFTSTGRYGCGPDNEDDVYTIAEFIDLCECHAFIDYDGHGNPVKDNKADPSFIVRPSEWDKIPTDATHIVWFNR